jgi:hypothetical protein
VTSVATYKVLGVSSKRVVERTRSGAPQERWLISWGKSHHVDFVIRYLPSKKGWRVLDIRAALEVGPAGGLRFYTGQRRHPRYWPSEDAAVMFAMAQTGTVPEVL